MSTDWDKLIESGLGILFPPLDSALDQDRTEQGLAQQQQAAEEARGMMGEQWNYLRGLNDPLIGMSDQQLQTLQQGIGTGQYLGREDIFRGYTPYTPTYEGPQQQMYVNQQVQPRQFSGPPAVTYDPNGQPIIAFF